MTVQDDQQQPDDEVDDQVDEREDDDQDDASGGDVDQLKREAAKRRATLRSVRAELAETVAERDRLRGVVEGRQRERVLELAGEHLADAADLLDQRDAPPLADLLGEDGEVDPAAVTAAAKALVERKPHLAPEVDPDDEDDVRNHRAERRPVRVRRGGAGRDHSTPAGWAQVVSR